MRQLPLPHLGTPDLRSPARFLWWHATEQKGVLLAALVLGAVSFGAEIVMPYVLGAALDTGLDNGLDAELLRWVAVLTAAALIQITSAAMAHRADVVNWMRAAFSSAELVGNHVVEAGDAISEELPTGEVVSAVANDALRMGDIYANASRFAGSVISYLVVTAIMLRLSVPLGLVIALGLPVTLGALALLVKPLQARQTVQREMQGRLTTLGTDTVAGLRILRGIGGEEVFADRYKQQSQRVRDAGQRVAVTQSWLDAIQILLPSLMVTLVLWLGAKQAVAGEITVGQLVTLYGYAVFLMWPLQSMIEVVQIATRAMIASRKIIRVLDATPSTGATAATAAMPAPGTPLHDEASGFTVHPGQVVAIVCQDPDASAALATRLARMDDDAERATPVRFGSVGLGSQMQGSQGLGSAGLPPEEPASAMADSTDAVGPLLADIDKDAIRTRIVLAEATAHLFSGPIRQELDVRGTATDEQVREAMHVADAQDVIDSIPGGLAGEIAEKGRSLSGGQRQRVALAQALLTEAEILVLIEPTSAVDAHTEVRIARRLAAARRGRTTVIVTASPLVLDHMDDVAVLRDGVVLARGTHRDLLAARDDAGAHYRDIVGRGVDDDVTPGDTAPGGSEPRGSVPGAMEPSNVAPNNVPAMPDTARDITGLESLR